MKWRRLTEPPQPHRRVLLCDFWDEIFIGYLGEHGWHSDQRYVNPEKLHRYRWTEAPELPTAEEWDSE